MVKRYRVLSSKVDTIAQRLKTAYQNQRLTEQMQSLTQQLLGAGNMMDIVKMTETMSNFEKLFDDLDVNSTMMDQVFDNVNAGTVNENEVNQLIGQIAQQNGLKLSEEFEDVHYHVFHFVFLLCFFIMNTFYIKNQNFTRVECHIYYMTKVTYQKLLYSDIFSVRYLFLSLLDMLF